MAAEALVAADALCQQGLEAQAEDMAAEDTLYALERAFQGGLLDAPAYLKQAWPPQRPRAPAALWNISKSVAGPPRASLPGHAAAVRPPACSRRNRKAPRVSGIAGVRLQERGSEVARLPERGHPPCSAYLC